MSASPPLALIVAVARNGVIGRDNGLPWHISADLKHFRELTMGKPIVMGRRTFDSIGRPLPGRHTVVLTRDQSWYHPGVEVAHDPGQALQLANRLAVTVGADEVLVAGGAELYILYLDRAVRIYRTLVHVEPKGDACFPLLGDDWELVQDEPGNEGRLFFSFQTLEKRA